jgi:uracil-DNA glycosylase
VPAIASLLAEVRACKYWPTAVPLPHPSPTNNGWLARNRWFERELVPTLRARVAEALHR